MTLFIAILILAYHDAPTIMYFLAILIWFGHLGFKVKTHAETVVRIINETIEKSVKVNRNG